jgi:endo-1,3-1,4-beta-glycanase ExoK
VRGLTCLFVCLLSAAPAQAQTETDARTPTETQTQTETGTSFVERFEKLNSRKWYVSDGWTNGAHQDCLWSSDNVQHAPGAVTLSLRPVADAQAKVSCAELQSTNTYGYGTYEVRMRAAAAPGLVTAFFTYTGAPHFPRHDEIDFEFLGKDARSVQLNYFADSKGGHERIVRFPFDASATTNDYAFDWRPDSLRWYINGELVHEVQRVANEPFPQEAGKIILSIWNGKGREIEQWLGKFVAGERPLEATYELVAFTEAGKPCQFPESIVCKFQR